tara:strand:- start:5803 stop:6177 length:375 start_codon:yes stop_codon:yes gene_type:complete
MGIKSQEEDLKFIESAIRIMNVKNTIVIKYNTDESLPPYPDIWIQKGVFSDTITITLECAKKNFHERRKRIVHELLHSLGEEHWDTPKEITINGKNLQVLYSTYPEKDTYSALVYSYLLNRINR